MQDILTWALSGGASVTSENTVLTDEATVGKSTRVQEKPELQVRIFLKIRALFVIFIINSPYHDQVLRLICYFGRAHLNILCID